MTTLYFQCQSQLARLRKTGELLPWEYGRDIGPGEYGQVLAEPFGQTNGLGADPTAGDELINHRLKNLLISKRLYATESCR
jgi:hypothetical protein